MAGRDAGVRIEGLREFRRDLKSVNREADRELAKEFRGIARDVAADARSRAPKRSGEYARSIKVYSEKGGASIGSRLPQAGVLHWGGTIRPKGKEIRFARRPVVVEAADRMEQEIFDRAGDAVDRAARKNGWK